MKDYKIESGGERSCVWKNKIVFYIYRILLLINKEDFTMNWKHTMIYTLCLTIILSIVSVNFAEEEGDYGNMFYMVMIKVKPGKIDKYLELYERTTTAKDNEFIISEKVFRHRTGPEWSILIMIECKDFAALQKLFERDDELFMEKFPDEKEREKIFDEFGEYQISHTDAIVIEKPKLGK